MLDFQSRRLRNELRLNYNANALMTVIERGKVCLAVYLYVPNGFLPIIFLGHVGNVKMRGPLRRLQGRR